MISEQLRDEIVANHRDNPRHGSDCPVCRATEEVKDAHEVVGPADSRTRDRGGDGRRVRLQLGHAERDA